MQHTKFWIFIIVIVMIMLGLAATFLLTGTTKEVEKPLSYVVGDDIYQDETARLQQEYYIARGGTSPFGIKILNATFIDEKGSVRNGTEYRSGESVLISYELGDIIPREQEGKFVVSLNRTLLLKTGQGLTVTGFNERYPFAVSFEVTEDDYYSLPQILTIDTAELIAGEYTLLIMVKDSYNVGYAPVEFTIV